MKALPALSSVFILFLNVAVGQTIIPTGANWKYLDNGTDQGTAWKETVYNDASWSNGPAQLGYGDNDENTVVSYGPNSSDKYVTTYFRHEFNITNANDVSGLLLRLLRDDGAVVYLNGTEVYRSNMPSGAFDYQTYAPNTISGSDENAWHEASIDAGLLVSGINLMAVEIHQRSASSSDISFDFELIEQAVLINQGDGWLYLDDGSDQGTAWKETSYNDVSWSSGAAQLGYGDGDETTVVSYGPNSSEKYTTTYFRKHVTINNPSAYGGLTLRLLRDDGAVVYINGTEVYRSNMPTGTFNYQTFAPNTVGGSEEDQWFETYVDPAVLVSGDNVVAVEIHQRSLSSSDISFDLELGESGPTEVDRGPYLQTGTPTSVIVKWRTSTATQSRVEFGTSLNSLNMDVTETNTTTEHEVEITGLTPNTKYYYRLSDGTDALTTESEYYHFYTAPTIGTEQPIKAWVLGDCGTGNGNARDVRNAYYSYASGERTDMVLLLGDNAYDDGTDSEYQYALFENMYEEQFAKSVLWSCPGNHDMYSANSANQSGPYYEIFTFPTAGEAGGLASGTESYFSWDYGNIHFVSLNSHDEDRSPNGAMLTWLTNDLANTTQEWIIAIWHHPAYSKGSHDSDSESRLVEMRENASPILEAAGVDLVLNGHSHSYERSYLVHDHYDYSWQLDNSDILDDGSGKFDVDCPYVKQSSDGEGAVYITAGSSGKISGGDLNHPVMFVSLNQLGSCAVEVEENRLDVKFVRSNGNLEDYFTMLKDAGVTETITINLGESVTLSATWPGDHIWSSGQSTREITVSPTSDMTYIVSDPNGCVTDTYNVVVNLTTVIEENGTEFKFYPNPTAGKLTLEFTSQQEDRVGISVSDLSGKLVFESEEQIQVGDNKLTVELYDLPNGNYLIQLAGRSSEFKRQFTIKR